MNVFMLIPNKIKFLIHSEPLFYCRTTKDFAPWAIPRLCTCPSPDYGQFCIVLLSSISLDCIGSTAAADISQIGSPAHQLFLAESMHMPLPTTCTGLDNVVLFCLRLQFKSKVLQLSTSQYSPQPSGARHVKGIWNWQ